MTEENVGVTGTAVTVRWTAADGERWQASLSGEALIKGTEKPKVQLSKNALTGVVRPRGPYLLQLGPVETVTLQVLPTTLWRRWRHRLFEVERLRNRVQGLEAVAQAERQRCDDLQRQLRVADEKLQDVARILRGTERGRDA